MTSPAQPRTYRRSECAVFFRSRDQHGDLSNMTFGFPLSVNGVTFEGPEGLYQALKFPNLPDNARASRPSAPATSGNGKPGKTGNR